MSGPFKMKGWSPFTQKEFKLKVGKGQGSKRKGKHTVDPDAPGYKYGPGYEPPVTSKRKGKYTETRKLHQPPTHIWDYKKRNEL